MAFGMLNFANAPINTLFTTTINMRQIQKRKNFPNDLNLVISFAQKFFKNFCVVPIFIRHEYGGLLQVPGIRNYRSTVVPVGGPCCVGYATKLIGHYRKAWPFTTASSGVIFGCPIGGVVLHLFTGICRGSAGFKLQRSSCSLHLFTGICRAYF